MRRRVVLYNPRAVFWTLPLGCVAVGSALDPERYEVVVVDGRLEAQPMRRLAELAEGAVCVGMGVLTGAPIADAMAASAAVRRACPTVPVVWGGWHPSLFPRACIEEGVADVVVVGQGERTFAELVDRLAAGEGPEGVAGTWWRGTGGEAVEGPTRALVDLAELPAHRYELIPVERYFQEKGRRQLDVISSTGCRFRCAFCADPEVYGRGWTGVPAADTAARLAGWYRRYAPDEFSFQDETFFTQRARVDEIAGGLLAAGVRARWQATLRADQGARLPDEVLARCRASGLFRVTVGVEAGTDAQLAAIDKDIRVEHVHETAEKLLRHGVGAVWNFILGFPGEDTEAFEGSLALARRLRRMTPDFEVTLFFFRPYPGTPLARQVAAQWRFPTSLREWSTFDYVGGVPPWVPRDRVARVDGFRFYQRYAWGRHRFPGAGLVRRVARWRAEGDHYGLPVERWLADRVRARVELS